MSATAHKASPSHPWRGRYRRAPEPHVEMERTCPVCGETKLLTAFRPTASGHRYRTCRPCLSRRSVAWDKANPERKRERDRRYVGTERYGWRQKRAALHRKVAGGLAPAPRRWWTTMRAAAELGLSSRHVVNLVHARALVARRDTDGRRWRVDPLSVHALIAQREAA